MEGRAVTAALATLVAGIVLGYLGQRSRMCFVGGIRDFILVRDRDLLRGLVAFGITAWLAFPLVAALGAAAVGPFAKPDLTTMALTVCGAFGVGYVSTLANGCPFRQHVLAAQGAVSSVTYVTGFLVGAVIFHVWAAPLLLRVLP